MSELRGANGYYKPFPRDYGAEYGLAAFQFQTDLPYYYVILAFLALATALSLWLRYSRYGLYLFAIRSDADAVLSSAVATAN